MGAEHNNWGASTEALNTATSGYDVNEDAAPKRPKRKLFLLVLAILVGILAIVGTVVGVLIAQDVITYGSKPAPASDSQQGPATPATPTNTNEEPTSTGDANPEESSGVPEMVCTESKDNPKEAAGTWTDVTSWKTLTGFNCTFTDELVGGLPLAGLNSTWDDSARANPTVPALNKPWGSYASKPFRGVSLGGWLSLEPFITPSLFDSNTGDEFTLTKNLGDKAAGVLEEHYASFISEADLKAIAAAGLDHVRIPFGYWAVKTYPGDPYVEGVSWRYLLRGIEWARKYGLRVKLDLHGAPGSQNGWNHSGKQGKVDWLEGPNGPLNAQRTLDIHKQLAAFFAQDRYKNVVSFYGILNEPALALDQTSLINWTEQAIKIVDDAGVQAVQVFSESMRGLGPWSGKLAGYGDKLVLDVHEYTIFSDGLIALDHNERINFACKTWSNDIAAAGNPSGGFGPVMVGEWSQAHTDCTPYLNGVGNGARWIGTFNGKNQPSCPSRDNQCSCDMANADPSTFTPEYKKWLITWAEAQMFAFEKSWGWFYWSWKTENAPLWSYSAGLKGGVLPKLAYSRDWDCSKPIPSFGTLSVSV